MLSGTEKILWVKNSYYCHEYHCTTVKSYGAKVTLEIAEGMYHTYVVMPFVKEARPGHQRLVAYLTVSK